MNVMMHFIYGGTLDFPDKADVGYVLLVMIFSIKVLILFYFSFVAIIFQSVSKIESSLFLPLLPYVVCVWGYLKTINHCI